MSPNALAEPSELKYAIPNFFKASVAPCVLVDSLVNMEFNAVPDILPLIPAFAINPVASATSSIEYFKVPAIAPAYLNVSPIKDTFVLELDAATAITSAKCPASLAFIPKAVKASVTISDVVPRLSPDAAARLRIPSIPPIISSVFQPAIAI